MSVKLLTEHLLEFLSLKGDCTGSSESTLVKMPHCWKSHVTVRIHTISTEGEEHFLSLQILTVLALELLGPVNYYISLLFTFTHCLL